MIENMYLNDDADMTVVFNAITNENMLSDKTWELVIDRHYEKFRYFYKLLKATKRLETISKMSVLDDTEYLEIVVEFNSDNDLLEFLSEFNEGVKVIDFKYGFYVDHFTHGRLLNIKIMSSNIHEEGDLYESIFDTDR